MDPLFHEGWVAFNERQWGVRAERIELGPRSGSAWKLDAVLYADSRGRLHTPPRNTHLPVSIETGEARASTALARKREAITALAEYVKMRGLSRVLVLSPEIDDVRPFQWLGFDAAPRYTYHIDLPVVDRQVHASVHKKIRKAYRAGYFCELTTDFDAVLECLMAPEGRKQFDHKVNAKELAGLSEVMGPDAFAAFLCRSADGAPVGGKVQFFSPGGMVHAWSAGVKREDLSAGVNQLLNDFVLRVFADRGCTVFDYCGANIPPVAAAKEAWGGRLVPYYSIRPKSFRNALVVGYDWLKTWKRPFVMQS